jgi:hypothetical protein
MTAVGYFDVSASDQRILLQSNMCHPNNGIRTMINPSGVYVSSNCSENQGANDAWSWLRLDTSQLELGSVRAAVWLVPNRLGSGWLVWLAS